MTAFVLGNGISRQGIDLGDLARMGQVYGCNALYREFSPWTLVATDAPIAKEIQESGYAKRNKFYTRRPLNGLGAETIPREWFGFSSGPVAAALASQSHSVVYLVGFDLGPNQQGTFNNVYAGTQFYKAMGSQQTFTGNWVKQLGKIFSTFTQVTYIRVCGETSACVADFGGYNNYKTQSRADFLAWINKSKGS